MADIDQTLRDVLVRLDALERENTDLRAEVRVLRADSRSAPAPPVMSSSKPLSRRRVLGRAMQVTAAAAAASVLMQRDAHDAMASHTSTTVKADEIYTHFIDVFLVGSGTAVTARSDGIGIDVSGGTVGVRSSGAENGVHGKSPNPNASGVYGSNTGNGFGVAGDTTSAFTADIALARAGVFGRNNGTGAGVLGLSVNGNGDGIFGSGKVGVHGKATSGNGLFGESGRGYGAVVSGGRAQLRLVPRTTIGKPTTGSHQVGELYLDKVGSLFICTAAGTPGTWKTVTVS